MKLSYFADGMSKYFDHTIYKFGTAKLVNKHGKYYLHIPVTYDVEESNISDICNVVGTLKSLTAIRRYTCLLVKTVVTNLMMTALEL